MIEDGQLITLSCIEGSVGKVYAGELSFHMNETNVNDIPKTETQIMLNIGNPSEAFMLSKLPCDGVGLARIGK